MTENISRKGPQNRRSLHGAPGQVGFAPNDKVEGGWFPVGIVLRDPRSQKRDLGHPSISPFDIAEGTSFVISLPTRLSESAARDDKGKGDGAVDSGCGTEAFYPLGWAMRDL